MHRLCIYNYVFASALGFLPDPMRLSLTTLFTQTASYHLSPSQKALTSAGDDVIAARRLVGARPRPSAYDAISIKGPVHSRSPVVCRRISYQSNRYDIIFSSWISIRADIRYIPQADDTIEDTTIDTSQL